MTEIKEMDSPEIRMQHLGLGREIVEDKQNFSKAVLYGFLIMIIAAILWCLISVITDYQVGYMALVLGGMIVATVRFQGNGLESPLVGQVGVIVEGVVIAAYQGSDSLGGYYIQEEDTDQDKDASTSEGIFIADTVNIVNAGDVVRVEGTVVESYALTSFENVTDMAVCSTMPL